MTDNPQPTQKLRDRLGNSLSPFGNAPTVEKTSDEETAKTLTEQNARGTTDQEQEEGYPGRTLSIADDLHIWLKMHATLRHTTMSKVVITELEELKKKYPLEPLLPGEE
jgi:hypothetical protein